MQSQEIIYPSDILAARDAAIAKNPLDLNGFGACRVNFKEKHEPKGGRTSYIPWQINLADGRGWKKVSIYFMNLKHVGKVAPLEERAKPNGVPDVALLFKGDYSYKRVKTMSNGQKVEIVEEYGKAKEWLSKSFQTHIKKHQAKGEMSKEMRIRVNVKHEREVKKDGKITYEPINPSNININVPFTGIDGNDAAKKDPKTKFRCNIMDVERRKSAGFDPKKEWPFEAAKARYSIKTDDGIVEVVEDLVNGNIHRFLRGGSECSGFDNMGDVCISQMGISNPSKIDVLMVKPSQQQTVNPSAISQDDWDSIGGNSNAPIRVHQAPTQTVELPDGSFTDVAFATEGETDNFTSSDGFDTTAAAGDEFSF